MTEYVYVRKAGRKFYPDNSNRTGYKMSLQEALAKGLGPSASYIKLKGRHNDN